MTDEIPPTTSTDPPELKLHPAPEAFRKSTEASPETEKALQSSPSEPAAPVPSEKQIADEIRSFFRDLTQTAVWPESVIKSQMSKAKSAAMQTLNLRRSERWPEIDALMWAGIAKLLEVEQDRYTIAVEYFAKMAGFPLSDPHKARLACRLAAIDVVAALISKAPLYLGCLSQSPDASISAPHPDDDPRTKEPDDEASE